MNPVLLAQIVGHSSLAMIQRVYGHDAAHAAIIKLLESED